MKIIRYEVILLPFLYQKINNLIKEKLYFTALLVLSNYAKGKTTKKLFRSFLFESNFSTYAEILDAKMTITDNVNFCLYFILNNSNKYFINPVNIKNYESQTDI